VGPLRQQITTLLIQNEKLRAARDLLLPRLMSGEIAV
jgi:type I restriction enzyme S subunit